MRSKFTATSSSAVVLQSVFMTGPSVDPVTLTDGRARLSFTQVTFFPLHAEQTRLNLVQVVASCAELGLEEADVRLVTAFLQRQQKIKTFEISLLLHFCLIFLNGPPVENVRGHIIAMGSDLIG